MTIKECIDIVDNIKPNQYSIREKVMWLSFIDEEIINDVLKTHEGYNEVYDLFEGYSEDKLSVELIVPSPYNRLYPEYLKMKIDSENGETARYNNSSALFNKYYSEYKKYYNKTHMPLFHKDKRNAVVKAKPEGLSDAEFENLKRELYYLLSENFNEFTSPDKIYDIVTKYVQNHTYLFKGNVVYMECKGYYIKSIDLENKKIYLCKEKVMPTISTDDNTDKSFETPAYEVGAGFNIINHYHYILRAKITAISHNVVTYEGDLGFTQINEDDSEDGHTFSVPTQNNVGVVTIYKDTVSFGEENTGSAAVGITSGAKNIVAGCFGANFGVRNTSGYGTLVSGGYNYSPAQHGTTGGEENENTGYCTDVHGWKLKGKGGAQHVRGVCNIPDPNSKFLEIVGNGKSDTERNNGRAFGRDGNHYHQGDVYVHTTFDEQTGVKDKGEKLVTNAEMNSLLNLKAPAYKGLQIVNKVTAPRPIALNVQVLTDNNTGIVYNRIAVKNNSGTLFVDSYNIIPRIPITEGKAYFKVLMRTNRVVKPAVVALSFFDVNGNKITSGSTRASSEVSTIGNGEWEQLIITVKGFPSNAVTLNQMYLYFAGDSAQGSSFSANAYFDLAGWAAFDDLDRAKAYDLTVDASDVTKYGYDVQKNIDEKASKTEVEMLKNKLVELGLL